MKLYIAICCDRHYDECVRAFRKPDKAIEFCKAFMEEYATHPENIVEEEIEGWLYLARYSEEGDCVRVEVSELDDEEVPDLDQ